MMITLLLWHLGFVVFNFFLFFAVPEIWDQVTYLRKKYVKKEENLEKPKLFEFYKQSPTCTKVLVITGLLGAIGLLIYTTAYIVAYCETTKTNSKS